MYILSTSDASCRYKTVGHYLPLHYPTLRKHTPPPNTTPRVSPSLARPPKSPLRSRPLTRNVPLNRRSARVPCTRTSLPTPLSMVRVRTSPLKFHLLTGVLRDVYRYLSTSEKQSPVVDGGVAKASVERSSRLSLGRRLCSFACDVMGCSTLWSTID